MDDDGYNADGYPVCRSCRVAAAVFVTPGRLETGPRFCRPCWRRGAWRPTTEAVPVNWRAGDTLTAAGRSLDVRADPR